ncbi:MAG: hypothetical protein AB1578_01225 [Thermodesulfobacteriota bacterium]
MGEGLRGYLGHLGRKARYGGLPRLLVDGLALLGITVRPFYLHREGLSLAGLRVFEEELAPLGVGFLGPGDMPALGELPGRSLPAPALLSRLERGQRCLGARWEGQVVAFTWCDLERCHYEGCSFALGPDQAYLFDAYCALEWRGRGLAPYLRYRAYGELEGLGRTELFSITDAFNVSALHFKEKLRARPVLLGLQVKLWGRMCRTRVLRRYPGGAPPDPGRAATP